MRCVLVSAALIAIYSVAYIDCIDIVHCSQVKRKTHPWHNDQNYCLVWTVPDWSSWHMLLSLVV